MVQMSQDVFDFFMLILGIVLAVIVFIIGFWVLDRSRRETPFYSLGYAMSAAWAGKTAVQLQAGEIEAMPMRVKDLEKMAQEGVSKTQSQLASKAEIHTLAQERDQLKEDTQQLRTLLKQHGIDVE